MKAVEAGLACTVANMRDGADTETDNPEKCFVIHSTTFQLWSGHWQAPDIAGMEIGRKD